MGSGDPSHEEVSIFGPLKIAPSFQNFVNGPAPLLAVVVHRSSTFWVEGKTNEAKRNPRWVVNYENYAKRKKKIKEEASGKIHLPHQPSTYIMTQPIFVLMPKKPKVSSIIYFDFTVVSYCRRKDRRRRRCKATSVSRKHFVIIRI